MESQALRQQDNPVQKDRLITHFMRCTTHDAGAFRPFSIDGREVGMVRPQLAREIAEGVSAFSFTSAGGLDLDTGLSGEEAFSFCSRALQEASLLLSQRHGVRLRGERYPVVSEWGETPMALLDRAATQWFGVRAFGVHVNGYVRKGGEVYLWIAKRSCSLEVEPGKLDNFVAGGLPFGITPKDNVIKESAEEAGVDKALSSTAVCSGTIRYVMDTERGVKNDTLFVYDMELLHNFSPVPADGEVESFSLLSMDETLSALGDAEDFKFNSGMVAIDFLLRHGGITTKHHEYADLVSALSRVSVRL